MKTDLFSFFHQRPDIKFNKRVFVFIICLVISLCSWLQINLSKDHIESIPVRVDFVNLPKTRFGLTKISDTLLMEVETDGFTLLKYKMKEIFIDFRKLKKDENTGSFYFLPNNFTKTISRQIGDNIKVVRAVTDTIQLIPRLR